MKVVDVLQLPGAVAQLGAGLAQVEVENLKANSMSARRYLQCRDRMVDAQ